MRHQHPMRPKEGTAESDCRGPRRAQQRNHSFKKTSTTDRLQSPRHGAAENGIQIIHAKILQPPIRPKSGLHTLGRPGPATTPQATSSTTRTILSGIAPAQAGEHEGGHIATIDNRRLKPACISARVPTSEDEAFVARLSPVTTMPFPGRP